MATLSAPADLAPSLNGTHGTGPPPAAHATNSPPRRWARPDLSRAVAFLGRLIHERFFWFLLAACAAAACCPGPGLWLRGVSFGEVSLRGEKAPLSLPALMLALLLFSAGLGVQTAHLRHLLRDPKPLLAGLAANLAIPVVFLVGMSRVMGGWLN